MNLLLNIQLALKSIQSNWLRTFLTILIIAIGISALVGILTSIDSIKASLVTNLSALGANSFTIRSKGFGARGGIAGESPKVYPPVVYDDAIKFKERFDFPGTVSINTRATSAATVKHEGKKTNPNVTVMGVDENYLEVSAYQLLSGRNFSNHEITTGQNSVILGFAIADRLLDKKDSLEEKSVSINGIKYRLIGVLAQKGSSVMGSDNVALVPAKNARRAFENSSEQFSISVATNNPDRLDDAVEEASGLFRMIRKLKSSEEDDFDISRSDKLATTLISNIRYVTTAATVIGIVTLLAAGIGLMNIMLVAVSERTREIGISKAIGATNQVIKTQFLTEAVVICQLGGIFGIILGIIVGNVVSILLDGDFIIPWVWMLSGFVFCFVIGILAGLYPAIKASKLDPIEALRYE